MDSGVNPVGFGTCQTAQPAMPCAPSAWVCLFSHSIPIHAFPLHFVHGSFLRESLHRSLVLCFVKQKGWLVLHTQEDFTSLAFPGRVDSFPTPAWQNCGAAAAVWHGWAGTRGLAAPTDPLGALLQALLLCDLEFSLLPQPFTHSTPQLIWLLFNVTFTRLCVMLLQLRNWLSFFFLVQFRVCWNFFLIAKAVGNGQNRKSLSVSSNSPLWLRSSVTHLFTLASCNSVQHLVLPHQSFFIYPKHHFPSLLSLPSFTAPELSSRVVAALHLLGELAAGLRLE